MKKVVSKKLVSKKMPSSAMAKKGKKGCSKAAKG